ncbi:Polyadenylate-binding protein/Hyperplastic disc protein [Raphanus sativus]|nr:Polyadenylate-binding protein/Hyperplastic disc protein [Raphanus sativus]
MIGETLYPLVELLEPLFTPEITGMLLELPRTQIFQCIESPEALKEKVNEAIVIIMDWFPKQMNLDELETMEFRAAMIFGDKEYGNSHQHQQLRRWRRGKKQPDEANRYYQSLGETFGGPGKDFGSMNMDELLKSIWTAEEAQAMSMTSSAAATAVAQPCGGGNLQRQGSSTLPRTISQKTVDEVWKCLITKDAW